MFDRDAIERAKTLREQWEAGELRQFLTRQPESRAEYRTGSGLPVQRVYTPEDLAGMSIDDLGLPGQYPFTRGPYPTMYRGRLWTMRQIAGFPLLAQRLRPLDRVPVKHRWWPSSNGRDHGRRSRAGP